MRVVLAVYCSYPLPQQVFDSPHSLDAWLSSPKRQTLLDAASSFHQPLGETVVEVPYARLARSWGLDPDLTPLNVPTWRVELVLLFVLYLTVLLNKYLTRPLLVNFLESSYVSPENPEDRPALLKFLLQPPVIDFIMLCCTVSMLNLGILRGFLIRVGPEFFAAETPLGKLGLEAGLMVAIMGGLVVGQLCCEMGGAKRFWDTDAEGSKGTAVKARA